MKSKILTILFFGVGGLGFLLAQPSPVNNLCHDEAFTEKIAVVSGVDLSTLTILDKLKFEEKSHMNAHHEYLNGANNATHDVHYVSHENMFPKWYTPPTTIRSDETGMKSYFATQSEYLVDGWVGGLTSQTEHGQYIEDLQTGERYLQQDYSPLAGQAYQVWNQRVSSEGFLTKYIFSYPSHSELLALENQGYDVSFSGDLILLKDPTIIMAWDIAEKVFVRQYLESNTIVKTVKTDYRFNTHFGEYLMHSVVATIPGTFGNGDCYETIRQTTYSNYTSGCNSNEFSLRGAEKTSEPVVNNQLEVFPNPAQDRITIRIPSSDLKTVLQVMNVNGEVLIHRQIDSGVFSYNIEVGRMPSGIYLVKCVQGKDNFSSKFVKQ